MNASRSRDQLARAASIAAGTLCLALGMASSASSAPDDVVLGSPDLYAPIARGFGTAEPRRIYNGGAASGLVRKISWKHWGAPTAKGEGQGFQYKPEGGYYDKPVRVKLRAKRIGQCGAHPKRAYTVLQAKFEDRPGGDFGGWFRWAGLRTICNDGIPGN